MARDEAASLVFNSSEIANRKGGNFKKMLVEKGGDGSEIKRRIADCRGRLRRQRASQKSAANDGEASILAAPEVTLNGDAEDGIWGDELMLEEKAKV